MAQEQVQIAIIGAGVGGLTTAIALKRKLNFDDFVIYERAGDIGGTWRDNTYPGCSCDIPTSWYSLSSDPNPDWTKEFSSGAEIFSYWNSLVTKYKLRDNIHFNSHVDECRWDSERHLYRIKISDWKNPDVSQYVDARVVISAVGEFSIPTYASELPGHEVFKGDMWHSGRWNHDVSLSGKRIAVIGNGCSATQFIPIISKDESTQVVNFCRSPHWRLPVPQFNIAPVIRWVFRYVPFALKSYRYFVYTRMDIMYMIFPLDIHWFRNLVTRLSTSYIKSAAPEKYHDKLIPKFNFGCKRTVFDHGYLRALHQPNLDLNWNGIDHFTSDGLVTKAGEEFKFDVIIFATGFEVMAHNINLIGSEGQSLQEYWRKEGGPTAYLGMSMPGFPNFFSILGPNSATGHASVIFTEEVQVNYIVQMIKPIIQGKVKAFEVRKEATTRYNEKIQEKLSNTVYTGCSSWYRSGDAHDGKIFSNYPGTHASYWWNTLVPRWEDYNASGVTNWKPLGRLFGLLGSLLIL